MRMLRAWLFRERAVRGPAAIELEIVDMQIQRELAALTAVVGGALFAGEWRLVRV